MGKTLPVGPSLLILNPARAGEGPTLELRSVDMREVFVDMNVIAEPPPGETYCQAPAAFRKVDTMAGRLEITLTEGKGSICAARGGRRKSWMVPSPCSTGCRLSPFPNRRRSTACELLGKTQSCANPRCRHDGRNARDRASG